MKLNKKIPKSCEGTYLKWQFLRRNKDYRLAYDYWGVLSVDDDFAEPYIEVCKKFGVSELFDYQVKNPPHDLFHTRFEDFILLEKFSIDDFLNGAQKLVPVSYELETSIKGKFSYLSDNNQALSIIVFDTSRNQKDEIKREVERIFSGCDEVKKEIKAYDDIDTLNLLVSILEKSEMGLGYTATFKSLKDITPTFKNLSNEAGKQKIIDLRKRALKLVKNAQSLEITA